MLGNLQHLHGKNLKTVLLKLLDDVSDRVSLDRVRLDDGESALNVFIISGLRSQVSGKTKC